MTGYRAEFDADVTFLNGGGLQTRGFKLDVPDSEITIAAGMTTYPALPGPEITPYLTREASRDRYVAGTEFAIDRITMVGNTGTYLDSPYHRYAGDTDLADLPAHSLLLAAGIPVVEHLTGLDQVPATGARFTATPPRLRTFPMRAFASVPVASPPLRKPMAG
jgi:kynurenine formamidase